MSTPMIRSDLLEDVYQGGLPQHLIAHIEWLTKHFNKQRPHVGTITLLPNFCRDNDMERYLQSVYDMNTPIFRGMIVELRMTYKLGVEDACWLYPQLYKARGLVELPKSCDHKAIVERVKSIEECKAVSGESKSSAEIRLSPLYNLIGVYSSFSTDNDFGIAEKNTYVGYDLSLDSIVTPLWKKVLDAGGDMDGVFKFLNAGSVEGHNCSIKQLVGEMVEAFCEMVTNASMQTLSNVTDVCYNCFYTNEEHIYFFNHAMNLLAQASRPPMLCRSSCSGFTLYKPKTARNDHKYMYAFPSDTGFKEGSEAFHSWDSMHEKQRKRIARCFVWNRFAVPYNTWLLRAVNSDKTANWKNAETTLQVIPTKCISLEFARVSSHSNTNGLPAADILTIHPGEVDELVAFPLKHNHEIVKKLIDKYSRVHPQVQIINDEFFDSKRGELLIPKDVAKAIV